MFHGQLQSEMTLIYLGTNKGSHLNVRYLYSTENRGTTYTTYLLNGDVRKLPLGV